MSNMCIMWDTLFGVPSSEDHLMISVFKQALLMSLLIITIFFIEQAFRYRKSKFILQLTI